jgi:hypothetical protein
MYLFIYTCLCLYGVKCECVYIYIYIYIYIKGVNTQNKANQRQPHRGLKQELLVLLLLLLLLRLLSAFNGFCLRTTEPALSLPPSMALYSLFFSRFVLLPALAANITYLHDHYIFACIFSLV